MKRRRAQHRPPPETPAKTLADLRSENRSLRRQLARLRRENDRLASEAEDEEGEEQPAPEEMKEQCPKCGSFDLGAISTPNGKTVVSCRSCKKWRSKAR